MSNTPLQDKWTLVLNNIVPKNALSGFEILCRDCFFMGAKSLMGAGVDEDLEAALEELTAFFKEFQKRQSEYSINRGINVNP